MRKLGCSVRIWHMFVCTTYCLLRKHVLCTQTAVTDTLTWKRQREDSLLLFLKSSPFHSEVYVFPSLRRSQLTIPLIVFPLGALKWPKITLFLTAWWVHHIHIKTEPRGIEQSLDACHKFERDPAVRLSRAASYELNCFFFQCEAVCSCSKSPSLMLPTGFGLVLKPQHQCFGQHHVGFLGVRSDQMRMRGWSDEAACTDCISAPHRQRYLPNSAK